MICLVNRSVAQMSAMHTIIHSYLLLCIRGFKSLRLWASHQTKLGKMAPPSCVDVLTGGVFGMSKSNFTSLSWQLEDSKRLLILKRFVPLIIFKANLFITTITSKIMIITQHITKTKPVNATQKWVHTTHKNTYLLCPNHSLSNILNNVVLGEVSSSSIC